MDKTAMYRLSYGLFVVTANEEGRDNGCISNTLIQAASEPNRVAFALNKANLTHDMVLRTGKFTASIISEEAEFDLFRHFGFQSGRDVDKFADFADAKDAGNGTRIITKGTNAFISGSVIQSIDIGSHTLFIADVTDMEVLSKAPSATYAYYMDHIKPKAKKAPEEKKGKVVWRCRICGYIYEGEELPADFICPLCKHPASDFERVVL